MIILIMVIRRRQFEITTIYLLKKYPAKQITFSSFPKKVKKDSVRTAAGAAVMSAVRRSLQLIIKRLKAHVTLIVTSLASNFTWNGARKFGAKVPQAFGV